MPIILYDVIALLLLLFFAISGYNKGFFLTLCNFIASFVAFLGALYLTANFAQPMADIVSPLLQAPIESLLGSSLDLSALESSPFWGGFLDRMDVNVQSSLTTIVDSLADFVALQLTRIALFLIAFLVIISLWFIVSRTLNLAFSLPILSSLNSAAGLVIGLVQGVLMIFVLAWVLNCGILSTAELEGTFLLSHFVESTPLAMAEELVAQVTIL